MTAAEPSRAEHPGVPLLGQIEKQLARFPVARLSTVAPRTLRWTRRIAEHDLPGVPPIRTTPPLAAHVALDESLLALVAAPHRTPRRADYQRMREELEGLSAHFEIRGLFDDPAAHHPTPPPLTDEAVHAVRARALGESVTCLEWDSGFELPADLPGAERWMAFEANRTAGAWVLERRDRPRPWVVLIHGLGSGTVIGDLAAFRAGHLHHDLGFNVAAVVLPVHGHRRASRIGGEHFLGYDQVNSLHGLTQSVWDVRRLVSWVRDRDATSVALAGMSLGGYLTALTSAHEPVDTVVAGIPATDFVRLFRDHAPRHVQDRLEEHGIVDLAATCHRVVSPLHVQPGTPHERRFIYAGLGDRLTPPHQAAALWEHWDRPEICWFPGGHLGFMGSTKVARFVDRALLGGAGRPV